MVKGKKGYIYLGFLFIGVAVINLLSTVINSYINVLHPRYLIIILLTAVLLIFQQKSTSLFQKVFIFIFHAIFVINLLIISIEVVLYWFNFETGYSFQSVISESGYNVAGIERRVIFPLSAIPGLEFVIRPIGMFADIHASLYILFSCLLTYIMIHKIERRKRLIYWFLLLILCFCLNGGQAIIATICSILVYEWLKSNSSGRIIIVLLILPVMAFLMLTWFNTQNYLNSQNMSSAYTVIDNTLITLKYFPSLSCYLWGCSLSPNEIFEVLENAPGFSSEIQNSGISFLGIDNGLIGFLLSFGALYLMLYFIGIVALIRLKVDIKYEFIAILTFQFMTIVHYPIGWGSGVFAFVFLNLIYVRWYYSNLHKKNKYKIVRGKTDPRSLVMFPVENRIQ
ncbi:hypothetical protein KJ966_04315 [bacterium]|nr:hypothetical protein [bacterium]